MTATARRPSTSARYLADRLATDSNERLRGGLGWQRCSSAVGVSMGLQIISFCDEVHA